MVLVGTFLARLGGNNTAYGIAIDVVFVIVAILAIQLVKIELESSRKIVFLNFAVLSITQGVAMPLYNIVLHVPLSKVYPYLYYDLYVYSNIFYFFWLSLIVLHLTICVTTKLEARKGLACGFALATAICLALYSPYFQDPRYAVKRPDAVDYRLVEQSVHRLQEEGDTTLSAASISKRVILCDYLPGGAKVALVGQQKEDRIAYLLTYLRYNNLAGITLAPLYRMFAYQSFLLVFILVGSSMWAYVKGPPTSAYLEKIAWMLVPYCLLEGFHHFVFSTLVDPDSFEFASAIGVYFSLVLLIGLAVLFALRLRFLSTVEGRYYERSIERNPNRLTRWRDEMDQWILRQFMNPGELDRRFLTLRKPKE
jgi:hypothetical protein